MKKNKIYVYTGLVCLTILLVISAIKGIFPFGDNSFIWGDMHDQITAFYYDFYDAVYGKESLFINFSTSAGINFFGILAYYILSPLSFLVLLVPRNMIYLVVSIIVDLKVVACSITCLYFLRKTFKNIPALLSSLLAIIYAFSGYSLVMYQITPWIDAMYMLPLIAIGLKKVLDLEKPTYYIVTLTLSLIFSFYVSIMVAIFIFLASFIYVLVYLEDKETRKKAILSLGISTILAILMSLFVVVPAGLEIKESSRLGFSLKALLNSKTGPLSDKLSLISFGGILYVAILSLFFKFKEHKKFLLFYVPTLLILLIPLIIEPINKVWHFGNYASFPYRVGFVMVFLLILGAGYYFDNFKAKETEIIRINKMASVFTVIAAVVLIVKNTLKYYDRFQAAIYRLSISFDSKLIMILLLTTLIASVASFIILLLNKNLSNFTVLALFVVALGHISINSYVYLGNDLHQEELTGEYKLLNDISKDYDKNDYYRVKNEMSSLITNSGMVMKYHNIDHFTSLTNKNSLQSFKKFGYGSEWVKIFSRGGNLFTDAILGNKYLLTDTPTNNSHYQLIKNYRGAKFYKLKEEIPYGVIISKNDTVLDKNNSFEVANSLYKNITGSEEDLFIIDNMVSLDNVSANSLENGLIEYSIIDPDYYAYIEKDVIVTGRKNIYLDVIHSDDNRQNFRINEAFNLYVNDKLVKEDAFTEPSNGTLDLGVFENERVNIKLELKKSTILKEVTAGIMDLAKYEQFLQNNNINTNIKFNRSKITAKVEGTKDKILFLPISYDKGYKATVNGHSTEVIKLYDNFIGIKLEDGVNDITIKYVPNGFIPTLIISAVTLVLTIVLLKVKLYDKLIDVKVLQNIAYYFYLFIYLAIILIVYICLTLCFMASYFIHFNV